MTGSRPGIDGLAALVAVNVTPLAGIFLLGWKPASVLISYCVDTYVGFVTLILLLMIHVTGDEHDTPVRGWRRWGNLMGALAFFAGILVLPLVLPMLYVLGGDEVARTILDDRSFQVALAAQLSMSLVASVRVHRQLQATDEDDRILTGRALFLTARWIVVFVSVGPGLVSVLGPRAGSVVVIAIYAGASIYFELFPERAAHLVRGRDAGPLAYGKDLESRARDRGDVRRR